MSESTTRPCAQCGGDRHWTGTRWRCAACNWAAQKRRRANLSPEQQAVDADRARELATVRRQARTPEKRARDIAVVQAWREANREQHRRVTHEWYQANLEYARAAKRAEYYAEPEAFYARNHVRKARLADAVCGHGANCVTKDLLKSIYAQSCLYCGRQAESADHFNPITRGGLNCVENLVPACKSCNSSKNNREPIEFLISVGILIPR
jgi:5-methylcytosine-specific restriction endonuclease McrA